MVTSVNTRIEPFQERDEDECLRDCNRITAEITVDGKVVWSESVETNDTIESVFGCRDELGWKAVGIAEAQYGYKTSAEEAESYGLLVTSA